MSEPLIEDWWEGNAPAESPAVVMDYGRGLAEDLYRAWWQADMIFRLMKVYVHL